MFKKGDLVRFKDGSGTNDSGAWGFKDQIAIVLYDDDDDATRVMILALRKGNHKNANTEKGIGVYTRRLEKL